MTENANESGKSKGGFAYLKLHDMPKLQKICSSGGKAATNRHRWTSQEAQVYGAIGGKTPKKPRKNAEQQ